jgi:hypothetical protein
MGSRRSRARASSPRASRARLLMGWISGKRDNRETFPSLRMNAYADA